VDEAFIRRIQYKVFAESPTLARVHADLRELLPQQGIEFGPPSSAARHSSTSSRGHLSFVGCQPRDLLDQAKSLAQYLEQPFELSPDLLEAACASYFVDAWIRWRTSRTRFPRHRGGARSS
jgi:hypothetical protein